MNEADTIGVKQETCDDENCSFVLNETDTIYVKEEVKDVLSGDAELMRNLTPFVSAKTPPLQALMD